MNRQAADYGEQTLGPAYTRIRFEDLCADPVPTVQQILDFFGLEGDAGKLAKKEVKPPSLARPLAREDPATLDTPRRPRRRRTR